MECTASVGFVVLALAEILCYNPNVYVCVHIFTVRGQTSTKAREGMNLRVIIREKRQRITAEEE